MKAFAELFERLDETNKTSGKIAALERYFRIAEPADAAWAIALLTGRRPKRPVSTALLRAWASDLAGIPEWLFGECYDAAGDLAETIARVLPPPTQESDRTLAEWVEGWLIPLGELGESEKRSAIVEAWDQLAERERFLLHKLITGGFRVGVSQELVVRGLNRACGVPTAALTHRLMGQWVPSAEFYAALIHPETKHDDLSKPYPFCLAHPLESEPSDLGPIGSWAAEWKWDGIRAQIIHRRGEVSIWTRGEELVTDRYPEVAHAAAFLPSGTVIDGELLAWTGDAPLPFAELQRRIGRKTIGKKLLAEVPVVLVAYDLLELGGEDLRSKPLHERRAALEAQILQVERECLRISPRVLASTWDELALIRAEARERSVEGLMLKRFDSAYEVGRKKGAWWKWKTEPFSVDAVLVYAQRGSGKRASLYTDYTFAVWNEEGALVPFAKAYSGLTDAEIAQVDRFVRQNTHEKFGPVRTVKPELVFELAFEGIQRSTRHKSGIAVRFPRIARWRKDKKPEDADRLETLKAMLAG